MVDAAKVKAFKNLNRSRSLLLELKELFLPDDLFHEDLDKLIGELTTQTLDFAELIVEDIERGEVQ